MCVQTRIRTYHFLSEKNQEISAISSFIQSQKKQRLQVMCEWIYCFHTWCHCLFWWCTVHVLAGSRRRRHSLMFVVHSFDVSASPLAREGRAKPSLFSPLLSYPLSTYPTNRSNTNNKPFIICQYLQTNDPRREETTAHTGARVRSTPALSFFDCSR